MIKAKGGEFITLISPLAVIAQNVKIGSGCIICPYVHIGSDAVIGDNVRIQAFSNVGHDSQIDAYATLQCYAFTGGFSRVGSEATLCTGAKLLPHKIVADKAVVGAGSVVVQNVAEEVHVFGLPAKEISVTERPALSLTDVEKALELEEGSLHGETLLDSLDCYDSFAKLSLISLLGAHGKHISVDVTQEWKTVGDILHCSV